MAIARARTQFPFPGYLHRDDDGPYRVTAEAALACGEAGATVLDFGAGSCDKTAVLQLLGFRCTAWDDLSDPWHLEGDNRQQITVFAQRLGIDLHVLQDGALPSVDRPFDIVLVSHVLEHLHDSPRDLMVELIARLRPGGHVVVVVPSAVNLRKRLDVLRGRTNLPPFEQFYNAPSWRGHIREYVADDLRQLSLLLGLEVVELRSVHWFLWKLPRAARLGFRLMTVVLPGVRDSWLLIARKPPGWATPQPLLASAHASGPS